MYRIIAARSAAALPACVVRAQMASSHGPLKLVLSTTSVVGFRLGSAPSEGDGR